MPEIWLACHGPLSCNSGNHVRPLAAGLARRGFTVSICVPERSSDEGPLDPQVPLITFAEAVGATVRRPDLVHLWTPRERMRRFLEAIRRRFGPVPHVVHLEDDEAVVLGQQLRLAAHEIDDVADGLRPLDVPDHLSHPRHARELLAGAAGITALIESLVADVSAGRPTAVFRPGFDPGFAGPRPEASCAVRRRLGIADGTLLTVYTGNVHASNVDEVRSLYLAVALANRTGLPMTLVRTGIDHVPLADHGLADLRRHAIELGCVPRAELPDLVCAADVLVQPGRIDDWNAGRVPSKLPEWLVSGRPVILPRTNLGADLTHGKNAIVLDDATAATIVAAFHEWLPQRDRLDAIGAAGRDYALAKLTWDHAADVVAAFLASLLQSSPVTAGTR